MNTFGFQGAVENLVNVIHVDKVIQIFRSFSQRLPGYVKKNSMDMTTFLDFLHMNKHKVRLFFKNDCS